MTPALKWLGVACLSLLLAAACTDPKDDPIDNDRPESAPDAVGIEPTPVPEAEWVRCVKDHPPEACEPLKPTSVPLTKNGVTEQASAEEVMAWWPHRPLFRLVGEQIQEVGMISTPSGGKNGDPRTELASVAFQYQWPPYSGDKDYAESVISSGGITLANSFAPDDVEVYRLPENRAKRINIRDGIDALMIERYRSISDEDLANHPWRGRSKEDFRAVEWSRKTSGGTLKWLVQNSTSTFSEDETIDMINRFVQVD